jgi:16S rRNA (cytidine1402-2'-O)-methyltransferase
VANTGRLIFAGTPIGNLSDATAALGDALTQADVIAAEDTRRARKLLTALGIEAKASLVSFFDGNEASRVQGLLQAVKSGQTVVVVSDAGMPLVSDPGYRLMRAAIDAGIEAEVVGGPTAFVHALIVSGLEVERFCFEGFLPRKPGERKRRLGELAAEPRTLVFYEAPHRLAEFLVDAASAFGAERQASVSRELTKLHEETRRGTLAELAEWAQAGVKGEIVVCVAGFVPDAAAGLPAAVTEVRELVDSGTPLKTAAQQVAAARAISRNALYNAALRSADTIGSDE